MKNLITPDAISLTTHHLHMVCTGTKSVLSSGTGFAYRDDDRYYLVTNWHNVSGRNPMTGACLAKSGAVPDAVITMFRQKSQPANCRPETIDIYHDGQMLDPVWYEHPHLGHAVDVVAIPLPRKISDTYKLFPINEIDFDSKFKEKVADEAFVVGYPFSNTTYLQMPIWKKASIASEPDIDVDKLPKFSLIPRHVPVCLDLQSLCNE